MSYIFLLYHTTVYKPEKADENDTKHGWKLRFSFMFCLKVQ